MNRGQRILLLLIGLTAAPFVLAQIAYHYYRDQPAGTDARRPTINNGTLVQPGARLADLKLQALPGPILPEHKWRLLLHRPAACGTACRRDVQRLRAIPTLIGREGERVAGALIVDDERTAASGADNPSPQLPRVRANGSIGSYKSGLYLVDPQGNVVLWYDSERIGTPLLKDLKFLLTNSSIG